MTSLLAKTSSVFNKLADIVAGFFAIIPQLLYFLYASMASLLDVGQLVLRKLIGLDAYYIKDADTGNYISQSGDILKDFVEGILGIDSSYSSLSTVFWSLLIFGVIVLVLTTILSIIKAHYNYDSEKSHPFFIIKKSFKSLCLMAMTPLVILFGVYLSEICLQTLDSITSSSTQDSISSVYERDAINKLEKVSVNRDGEQVDSNSASTTYYNSYDMFGVKEWTNTMTFSGEIFELMTRDCNRVRLGSYTATQTEVNTNWDNCGIFYCDKEGDIQEDVAYQIDYAFANALTMKEGKRISIKGSEASCVIASTLTYGPSAVFSAGLLNVEYFSKFNVGLVWYYYNLWAANYLIGYIALIAIGTLLFGLLFGLMKRLILCVALFVIQSPVIGISPLDGGNGFNAWKKTFVGYFFSGYGAAIGINLFFLLVPVIESMEFFTVAILNKLFNLFVVIAGLTVVSKLVKMIASFVGGNDIAKEGTELKDAMKDTSATAATRTLQTANVGLHLGKIAVAGGGVVGTAVKAFAGKGSSINLKERKGISLIGKRGNLKGVDVGQAIGRFANSNAGRIAFRYLGVSNQGFHTREEKKEERKTAEDVLRQEYAKAGKTGSPTKEEIREKTKAIRASKGFGILKQVGSNTFDISKAVFRGLEKSTGLKSVLDKLTEKKFKDEAKMVVQNTMKMAGMDTSVIEKGGKDDEFDWGSHFFSTDKQLEKRSKRMSEAKTADMENFGKNNEIAKKNIDLLVNEIKKRV